MSIEEIERDLNSKILSVTMSIKEKYPELSSFLEEMPITIPSMENVEISIKNLSAYNETLNLILNKYKLELPNLEKQYQKRIRTDNSV